MQAGGCCLERSACQASSWSQAAPTGFTRSFVPAALELGDLRRSERVREHGGGAGKGTVQMELVFIFSLACVASLCRCRDPRALFGVAAAVSLGTEEALWVDNRTIVLQRCGGR